MDKEGEIARGENLMGNETLVKDRMSGLGGSDAGVIAGLSPYKSPAVLYYEKIGDLPIEPLESEAVEWGNRLEGIVAEAYTDKTGRQIRTQPRKAHPAHDWMLANVDRQIIGDPRGPGILEIKTTNTFMLKDWENGPPDSAMLQLQHYLAVYGYSWGSIAVLIGGQNFRTFDIERDEGMIHFLIELEEAFWHRVKTRNPPTLEWDANTADLMKRLYPRHSIETKQFGPEADTFIHRFVDGREMIKTGEALKAEGEAWIKANMGTAGNAETATHKISWINNKDGSRFDQVKFKAEQPALFEQYQTIAPGPRVFRLTERKGKP